MDEWRGGGRRMKNKEFYANEIIDMALNAITMGVDKDTLAPCSCISIGCAKCLGCANNKILEWAEAEHVEQFAEDEVVLWKDSSTLDETIWKPAHYAHYKNGHHYVYNLGCSSLTTYDKLAMTIKADDVIKYDKNLVWGRVYE